MDQQPTSIRPPGRRGGRRGGRYAIRYASLLVLVLALMAGWSLFWKYAAGQVRLTLDGWQAREAKAGRVYACGSRSVGGFPFRFEVDCNRASAIFHGFGPPLKIETRQVMLVAQVYQPSLLIGRYTGPLTIAEGPQGPRIIATWRMAESSLRGTPRAPERAALVLDRPEIDQAEGDSRQTLMRAKHVEIHGRVVEGSVTAKPVIELALELDRASLPVLHRAAIAPINANIIVSLFGLRDFSPKPWPQRFREIEQAGGRIEIVQARIAQGATVAIGKGALRLEPDGKLQGALHVTIAGIEPLLKAIGVPQMVEQSSQMNKVAGILNRLSPGLGDAARQQAGTHIALGLDLIGRPTTLDGRQAVTLPLRFEDGAMFLGPIPIGQTPALF